METEDNTGVPPLDIRIVNERSLLKTVLFLWDQAWPAIEKFSSIEFHDEAFTDLENRALWRAMTRARADGAGPHMEDLFRRFLRDTEIRKRFRDPIWDDPDEAFRGFMGRMYANESIPIYRDPNACPRMLDGMMRMHNRERVRRLAMSVAGGNDTEDLSKALEELQASEGVRGGPKLVRAEAGLSEAGAAWHDDALPEEEAQGIRIPWGIFPRFDRHGAYIRDTDYAVLAGRTGRGKSTCALAIAMNAAQRFQRPVVYVSLEMPARQVWQKAVLSLAGVEDPKGSAFSPSDQALIDNAAAHLRARVPLVVVDTPPPNLFRLKSYMSTIAQEVHPILMVVDYLGLIQAKGEEYQRVTLVSQHMRAWAMSNTPLLMLHQLNRGGDDGRKVRPPRLRDLRGSGQIEQDATHVVLLHEAGGENDPTYDYETDHNADVPMLALLSKVRQGNPGIGQRYMFERAKSRTRPL